MEQNIRAGWRRTAEDHSSMSETFITESSSPSSSEGVTGKREVILMLVIHHLRIPATKSADVWPLPLSFDKVVLGEHSNPGCKPEKRFDL